MLDIRTALIQFHNFHPLVIILSRYRLPLADWQNLPGVYRTTYGSTERSSMSLISLARADDERAELPLLGRELFPNFRKLVWSKSAINFNRRYRHIGVGNAPVLEVLEEIDMPDESQR